MSRIATLALIAFIATGLFTSISTSQGQSKPDPAGKPKPPTIVAIKKADGSSVRGQLVSADGVHLTLKPGEGTKYGEPVEIKWLDVKSVSNGLTQ